MALILKATTQVQVPHQPSPGDEAGAVPRDTTFSSLTAHPATAGLTLGQDGYTGHVAPIPCPGNSPTPEDPAAHRLQGPTSSTTAA
eukprot:3951299-Karenia_brevis.AAC.1